MEMIFPPSFFMIMVHLVVHLVDEVKLGGPVSYRWMYNIESEVFVIVETPSVASNRDTHGVFGDVAYYGKLVDIIELNYYSKFVVTLFQCIWADTTTPRGIRRDSYGFTEVNFSRTIHVGDSIDDEPYVLAEQAQMVFYVTNEMEKDWNVAIPFKPRDFFDMGENVDSSVYDCTSVSSENQNPMVLNEIENLQLTREKLNDEITIIVDSGIERTNND
nr:uncharacterized protein LOC109190818 [Ipomoea batatas]